MKKYHGFIEFMNEMTIDFETDTDIRKAKLFSSKIDVCHFKSITLLKIKD